jgi:hypothetical protein
MPWSMLMVLMSIVYWRSSWDRTMLQLGVGLLRNLPAV